MTKQQYLKILKRIIDVETPYVERGNIIFLGVYLDKFIVNLFSKNPVEEYVKEVLRLYKKKEISISTFSFLFIIFYWRCYEKNISFSFISILIFSFKYIF